MVLLLSGFSLLGCTAEPKPAEPKPAESKPEKKSETTQQPIEVVASTAPIQKPIVDEPPLDATVDVDGLLSMRLSEEDLSVGWIRLFDGQSMTGWRNAGTTNWRVEDGSLVADSGDAGLLCTSVRFSDFELIVQYKGAANVNSGVFLRTPTVPKNPAEDCYELNIAPADNPFPTGSLVGRVKVNEQFVSPDPEEWHTLHALVDGDRVQAWVDDVLSADYVDTAGLTSGWIGLQFREGAIQFRDIRVRPISYAILPAKELKDFGQPVGAVQAKLNEQGELLLEGGKGHLELLQPYANCCIQVSVQTLADNVNSGLFFRCVPGEDMNGYECQLHHGFNEDRRRPVDSGMGAIFRRQNAKAVLSDSDKRTFVSVIADGPFFGTWVNGVQVVDWEDTRTVNANPRKGLRTEAGTIMLQGHDPGCKIRFSSLSICPIP